MMLKTLRMLSAAAAVALLFTFNTGCDREAPATTAPEDVQGAPLMGEATPQTQSQASEKAEATPPTVGEGLNLAVGEGQNLFVDGKLVLDAEGRTPFGDKPSAEEIKRVEAEWAAATSKVISEPQGSAGADLAAAASKAAEDAKKKSAPSTDAAARGAASGGKPATAAEATDEALAAHKARIASQPMPKALAGYEPVRFDRLAGFVYLETPPGSEPVTGPDGKPQPVGDEQIPPEVMALDGKKVTLRGHMIPIDFHKFSTNEFILVQAVPDCYFCSQPMPNEWIEVKTKDGSRVTYAGDEPVTIAGTLKVGAIFKGRYLESLYRVELDQIVE